MQPPVSERSASSFLRSLGHAYAGLVHAAVSQRNMRIHLLSATLVGLVGSGVPLGLAEKVILIFCVLLVLFAEVLNSALEHLVDLATEQLHEKARVAKDAAAAGVLVLASGTVVVFLAVLAQTAPALLHHEAAIQRQVLFGAPLTFLVGLLMHETPRPSWIDGVALVVALTLWTVLLSWTESYLFSALVLALIALAASAARGRRRLLRPSGRGPESSPEPVRPRGENSSGNE